MLYERLWSLKKDLDTISVAFDVHGYYRALDRAREIIKEQDATMAPDVVEDHHRLLAFVEENHKKRQSLPPLPNFPEDR
jgi:hypothetical protein